MYDDEILDIVDEDDTVIGQASRSDIYRLGKSNFRVINAFLRNDRGQLWIPRRTATKRLFPLCLDVSIGGHVQSGETYEQAFKREAKEELLLDIDSVAWRQLGHLSPYDSGVSAFMRGYEIRMNELTQYNRQDFMEGFWFKPAEILEMANRGEPMKDDLPRLIRIFYAARI